VNDWVIRRLSDDNRPGFDCADNDLNEFFSIDSIVSDRELLSVTYVVEFDGVTVAFFSLSNDAVKKRTLNSSRWEKLTNIIPSRKRYASLPAVKIGRLATTVSYQSSGLGSEILDFIKDWFTNGNKTGCRFITIDAYNNPRAIRFYEKNGFTNLLPAKESDKTTLMIFDLMTVRE
jgi:GNAT superfamily N-acetyltransferase